MKVEMNVTENIHCVIWTIRMVEIYLIENIHGAIWTLRIDGINVVENMSILCHLNYY